MKTAVRGVYHETKAFLIRVNPSMDMGDVVQVARAEGKKLFKTSKNVKVVDLVRRSETEFFAVVQAPEVVSGRKLRTSESPETV